MSYHKTNKTLFTLFTKILQSHTQNMAKGGLIVGGAILLIFAVVGYVSPVNDVDTIGNPVRITIPNAVGICNSDMGQIGQAYRADVAQSCSEYSLMVMGIYGSGILGIVLIAGGAAVSGKKQYAQSLEERFHKGELTQGEFESKKSELEPKEDETSMKILKERYAKGEISKDEFDKKKKDRILHS